MNQNISKWLVFLSILGIVQFMPGPVFSHKAFAGEVIIVANKSVPVNSLRQVEIKNIFLGKKSQWNKNMTIKFGVLLKSPKIHTKFLRKYLKKTPSQFKRCWRKRLFSGKGGSPNYFDTQEEFLKFLSNTDGAIGYIASEAKPENLKRILVK